MEIRRLAEHPLTRPAVLYALWTGLFFLLFARSWVSEDAYITFRVIDNFVHGYGLRWNVNERVQAYTHPLWLLLHLPFAMIWNNLFHLNMALSLVCASMAVAAVIFTFDKSLPVMAVFFVLPLFLSKCFVDYAGSGLETSLSYLLFSMLGYVLIRMRESKHFFLALSFTTALLLLNRLDHSLLVAPLLATIAWQERVKLFTGKQIGMVLLGALPLICWFIFSLLYYGFFFPNTKYAKLNTELPFDEYLAQGLQYSFIWLTHDTVSVLLVVAALIMAMRKTALYKAMAAGIILNLLYVVSIGGDYMMGRFFAVIFFVALWLLLAVLPSRMRGDIIFASVLMLATATTASYYVRNIRSLCEACIPVVGRVMDAKRTFGNNSLFSAYWPPSMREEGEYKFAREGRKIAQDPRPLVKPLRFVGMQAYYGGSDAIFIDELALADALMARLPARTDRSFYIGHFRRNVPAGYQQAISDGDLSGMQSDLAEYYSKLRLITQGDLWDKERLETIIHFNLGAYDHFRTSYLDSKPQ